MASLQKKVYDERPLKTEYELIPLGESFMEAIKYTAQWREM
ncbi:winged helix-turn-helix transcriptional regulator [Chryseobacterium sp. NRRL B-14859]|nr:winged helix-turn-helix transcriptional regulator [Chryseobacterium sp. G0240]